MLETFQMLSVHVHIHAVLRSLYRKSEVLNCDYIQMNIFYLQWLATLNMVDSSLYNFCSSSLSFSVGGWVSIRRCYAERK